MPLDFRFYRNFKISHRKSLSQTQAAMTESENSDSDIANQNNLRSFQEMLPSYRVSLFQRSFPNNSASLINEDFFMVLLIVLKIDHGSVIVQNGEIRSSKFS